MGGSGWFVMSLGLGVGRTQRIKHGVRGQCGREQGWAGAGNAARSSAGRGREVQQGAGRGRWLGAGRDEECEGSKRIRSSTNSCQTCSVCFRVAARADALRLELLPELLEVIKGGFASATTDGWTEGVHGRHFVTLTLNYIWEVLTEHHQGEKVKIKRQWIMKMTVLYTSYFGTESETAENLLGFMKTQTAIRGVDPDLLNEVHFVTDGGMNFRVSLTGYSWSYCFDHCLNIVLQTSFSAHLVRIDLYGEEAGAIVDSVRSAVGFLKSSRVRALTPLKAKLKAAPRLRLGQTKFTSCMPMLRATVANFDEVRLRYEFLYCIVRHGRRRR